jgi:Lrp/AsnC family leucine-responsive transcriptional regulator
VIKQYTVLLDAKKINKDLTAFISVSLEHPKYNDGFVECIAP